MELRKHYEGRVSCLTARLKKRKARNRYFISLEIATFAAVIASVAVYTATEGYGLPCLLSGVAATVAYIVTRWADGRNSDEIEQLESLLQVNSDELAGLAGDYSPFDDGQRFADPHHPYTYDLDIFGPESLFQRINRTATTGGSEVLARALGRDLSSADGLLCEIGGDIASTVDRQAWIINEFAARVEWRERFIATGKRHPIDTAALLAATKETGEEAYPLWLGSRLTQIAITLLPAGLIVCIALAVAGEISSTLPTLWATVQFFLALFLTQRPLQKISKRLGKLTRQVKPMMDLARLTGQAGHEWQQLDAAEHCWHQLAQIVKAIDRRGNLLGLLFGDALFLSDIRLVARVLRWQRVYLDRLPLWVKLVTRCDALVSMATMRYNHPEAGSAEMVEGDGVKLEARGLWHPFLGRKAVKNDFTVADRNFYIITGANMAGKSTFLRAVGVNYVLAMNGMPVFAEVFRCKRFNLFSSMRTSDDLAHGISYFNAELLRIKQLIASCEAHRHTLIILDEILKGTNSLDKLNGSRMFLEWISRKSVSGIVATHDLELSKMEGERFHNYCFEIGLGDKVTYSYKITQGVARNQNATFLLRQIINDKQI